MEIYLIRHTTPDIPKGTCYGASDLEVVDTFPQEAAAIKSVLPNTHQEATIISSPLIRCKQLAYTLFENHSITIEESLKEMSFGDWELTLWKEIDQTALKAWFPHFVTQAPPNGETFQQVFDRANAIYERYTKGQTPQLFIVAHSAIIRAILCQLQSTPLKEAFKENMDYGVVYQVKDGQVTQLK